MLNIVFVHVVCGFSVTAAKNKNPFNIVRGAVVGYFFQYSYLSAGALPHILQSDTQANIFIGAKRKNINMK